MLTGGDIIASAIEIAGTGFTLSLILNAISCELANAPPEIRTISKRITLYSLLLKQTATVLQHVGSVHSQEALRNTDQVLDESNVVLGDINALLDSVRGGRPDGSVSPSMPQKMKWSFKKHNFEYLLGRMDRLQLSLSLMLQIIQLGTTMAATSRYDAPARVQEMTNKIQRERVEAQTVVIQYYHENQALHGLYIAAKEEQTESTSPASEQPEFNALTLIPPADSHPTKVENEVATAGKGLVVSRHTEMFTDMDEDWARIGESKEDMVRRSEAIINKLLERWTVWRERREQNLREPRQRVNSRYKSGVQDLHEDDDDSPYHERYRERENSPGSRFIEGTTTNWRQPHSSEARQEARRLRKAYEPYQPNVEGSSDIDDSNSQESRKRPTRKHIIDSDPDTSESEEEKAEVKAHPRRRSSAIMIPSEQSLRYLDDPTPISKSLNAATSGPPLQPTGTPGTSRQPVSPTWPQHQQHRPYISPDQNKQHHSFSSPNPSAYTHQSQYQQPPFNGPQSPGSYLPASTQAYPFPPQAQASRYMPRLTPQTSRISSTSQRPGSRDGPQQRPMSRDGKPPRSPSRLTREYTTADYRAYEEEKKRQKKEARRNLSDGAAKGLLAGSGLAIFLEALDSLSL